MKEFFNAFRAPFVDLDPEEEPRPAVMATAWLTAGLLLTKVLS